MPPDPRVHVGVCAVVRRRAGDDSILLMVQRTGTASYADGRGTWSVPGGWVDFGESPSQTARREVHEETGVEVAYEVEPLGFVSNLSDDRQRHVVTLFMGCRYLRGEARVTEPDKCGAVEWVEHVLDGRPLFLPLRLWIEQGRP